MHSNVIMVSTPTPTLARGYCETFLIIISFSVVRSTTPDCSAPVVMLVFVLMAMQCLAFVIRQCLVIRQIPMFVIDTLSHVIVCFR